jgi:hypothetical protein
MAKAAEEQPPAAAEAVAEGAGAAPAKLPATLITRSGEFFFASGDSDDDDGDSDDSVDLSTWTPE